MSGVPAVSASGGDRPNVVVIQTDDQGAWAMPHRTSDLVAPNIARLLEEGTELENFYCASPVCSPARASLLTGLMPSAHGVHDWVRGEAYGQPDAAGFLDGLTTTPQVLAEAGWVCGHSGKWHLGDAREPAPGFHHWYAHRTGDGPYYGAPVWQDGQKRAEPRYITDAITDEAVAFIAGAASGDAPFYLEVNYTAPHSPWVGQHPEWLTRLYEDCAFTSIPVEPPHPWFSWEPGPVSDAMHDPRPSLVGYFASLSGVDDGVGRILAALVDAGVERTTYVVYTSDNGFSCGHHGIWGKGNATRPLNLWENSVRVPFVIRRPGTVPAGAVVSEPASASDLHPTILELAGVHVPPAAFAAGRSRAADVLGSGAADVPRPVFTFDEYGGTRMVRTREWKLVVRADGPDELYDMVRDPDERTDLAADAAHAKVRAELESVLEEWFSAHVDPERDAYHRPVSGRGQLLPLSAGRSDEEVYHAGIEDVRPRL